MKRIDVVKKRDGYQGGHEGRGGQEGDIGRQERPRTGIGPHPQDRRQDPRGAHLPALRGSTTNKGLERGALSARRPTGARAVRCGCAQLRTPNADFAGLETG
jgi:hypothetical protein